MSEHRLEATFQMPHPHGRCSCGETIEGPDIDANHARHTAQACKPAGLAKARKALSEARGREAS